jgi:hypothetical protein
MTDQRTLWCAGLLLALFALVGGCGLTESSAGGEGTETHWLSACSSDQDCQVGQCLCGSCTLPCANLLDCPAPLDRCSIETSDGASCEQPVCGSSQAGEITSALQRDTQIDSCEDGRPTSLRLRKDLFGVEGVSANRDRGFVLWEAGGNLTSLVGVAPGGDITQAIWHPSDLSPLLSSLVAQPDGSLLTAGRFGGFDGYHAWVGQVGSDGALRWEVDLGRSEAGRLVILEDGGALVRGLQYEEGIAYDEGQFELFWSRLDGDGNTIWSNRVPLGAAAPVSGGSLMDGEKLTLLSDQTLRIVEKTEDGFILIQGDLDGAFEQSPLTTTITDLTGVVGLRDGRLVLAGTAPNPSGNDFPFFPLIMLAFVSRDGIVEHEQAYGGVEERRPNQWSNDSLQAFTFNAARNEVVLVGNAKEGGSWMLATDLQGEPVWELRTAALPTNIDGDVSRIAAGQGPLLVGVAAATDGSVLATGFTYHGLVYMLIGAGDCTE